MSDSRNKIEAASKGLMMLSESDYPFEYFQTTSKEFTKELLLSVCQRSDTELITEINLDYLFRNAIKTYSESSLYGEQTANRFRNLIQVLKLELDKLKVYRIGDVQVDVIILGIADNGFLEGLKTRLIET